MKIINGNILDITEGVIVHQVNCKGVMGAGLALQIKNKWPVVFKGYKNHLKEYNKLGVHPLGTMNGMYIGGGLWVINFYSQDNYGTSSIQTNYLAFEECLLRLVEAYEEQGIKVAEVPVYFPYGIGCGLAGGDWKVISKMIEKYIPYASIVKLN